MFPKLANPMKNLEIPKKTKSVAKNDISIVEELDQTGSNRNTAVSVMLPCTLQFNFIPFLFNDDSIFFS